MTRAGALLAAVGLALAGGASGLNVAKQRFSAVGIGTWSWGNRLLFGYSSGLDDRGILEAYDIASRAGINWADTGDTYGTGALEGRAEVLLGQCRAKGRPLYVATKLAPFPWRLGEGSMRRAFEGSAARLGGPAEVVQLHWPPPLRWQEDAYLRAFAGLVTEGSAQAMGLSNYGPRGLERVAARVEALGARVVSNQLQLSLLNTRALDSGAVALAEELGIQTIGYSSLGLGVLTDAYGAGKLPRGARGRFVRELLPEVEPLLGELRAVAAARRKTPAQVATNWCVAKGVKPLVGVRTPDQARQLAGTLGWRLSSAEVDALDAAARRVGPRIPDNVFQTA